MTGQPQSDELEPRRGATSPHRFVFGGVAFDLYPPPGVTLAFGPRYRKGFGSYALSPVVGHVSCALHRAASARPGRPAYLGRERSRKLSWRASRAELDVAPDHDGARYDVQCGSLSVELRDLGASRYVAAARVAGTVGDCEALVSGLSAVVTHVGGGLVMHAFGLCVRGRAVLLTGPSGAGKSTAGKLAEGATSFAEDRVAVYPTPLGWYAAGLPEGSSTDTLPRAQGHVFPLGGVLQVRQAQAASRVERLRPEGGLLAVRAAVYAPDSAGPQTEAALLDRAAALAAKTPVGELHSQLGVSHFDAIERWLSSGSGGLR